MTVGTAGDPHMPDLVDAVIREVAGVPVDIDTGFFEAGLTSVLVVRIGARLAERLGRPIPVWAPFKYPTRRALAKYLGDLAAGGADGSATVGVPVLPLAAGRSAAAPNARRLLRARIREERE